MNVNEYECLTVREANDAFVYVSCLSRSLDFFI